LHDWPSAFASTSGIRAACAIIQFIILRRLHESSRHRPIFSKKGDGLPAGDNNARMWCDTPSARPALFSAASAGDAIHAVRLWAVTGTDVEAWLTEPDGTAAALDPDIAADAAFVGLALNGIRVVAPWLRVAHSSIDTAAVMGRPSGLAIAVTHALAGIVQFATDGLLPTLAASTPLDVHNHLLAAGDRSASAWDDSVSPTPFRRSADAFFAARPYSSPLGAQATTALVAPATPAPRAANVPAPAPAPAPPPSTAAPPPPSADRRRGKGKSRSQKRPREDRRE